MRLGLGLGLAGPQAAAEPAPPAENLLLWTEEFQDAVWVKTSASVIADANSAPDSSPTADLVTHANAAGAIRQVTTTAAAGSAVTALATLSAAWQRFQVSGDFGGTAYTFSVYARDAAEGFTLRLRLDVSGGFLRCSIEDFGDVATYLGWGAQLEVGSSASAYVPRTT